MLKMEREKSEVLANPQEVEIWTTKGDLLKTPEQVLHIKP